MPEKRQKITMFFTPDQIALIDKAREGTALKRATWATAQILRSAMQAARQGEAKE